MSVGVHNMLFGFCHIDSALRERVKVGARFTPSTHTRPCELTDVRKWSQVNL